MASSPLTGRTLAHYRVAEKIGAGGMGEVYRARDTKLGREVAVKVLPETFARNPERMGRFEREARLLASLNHPNIAAIYGLEEADNVRFLVLELVEGQTLADRLKTGSLPLEDALGVCRQIAEALEAAHEKGIIHRDLKPANVKVTPAGKVKVLDFGLAKAFVREESPSGPGESPTLSDIASREGVLLGTAAYMSPEQARAKPVDKRTDVWAFGCVLYELLTGEPLFHAQTVSDTIAGILRGEPDWGLLPGSTPASVRTLLRRCLQKDPARRLHDIADARIEIEEALSASPALPEAAPTQRRGQPLLYAAAGGLVVLAALIPLWFIPAVRERLLPSGTTLRAETSVIQLTSYTGTERSGAISPDGKYFAYVSEKGGPPDIWVRQVSGGEPIQITRDEAIEYELVYARDGESIYYSTMGSEGSNIWRVPALGGTPRKIISGGRYPAPSPDGRELVYVRVVAGSSAFSVEKGIIEISQADGSAPRKVYEGQGLRQVSWSPDGRSLVFTEGRLFEARNLLMIDTDGQNKRQLTHFTGGWIDWQTWLPDGRHVVFTKSADPFLLGNTSDLWVVSVDGASARKLTLNINARFVSPSVSADGKRLLLTKETLEREVWRVPLGPDPKVNGTAAVRLLETSWDPFWIYVTRDGSTLLFTSPATGSRNLWTMPLDGSGRPVQITLLAGNVVSHASLSPDKTRVAFASNQTGNTEIWVMNVDGANPTQLTHDPAHEYWPIWSPDGKWIAFGSTRGGLWKMPATGGEPTQIPNLAGFRRGDWSPQGDRFVTWTGDGFEVSDAESGKLLLSAGGPEWGWTMPVWSPDGRYFSAIRHENYRNDSVWIFDAATGDKRLAAQFQGRFHLIFRVGWGKDGKSLIVNRNESVSDIVLLENF